MKKKIAIITLHSVSNYGSVLQAYATQCYFENLGYEVNIIDYRRPWEIGLGYWFYLNEKSPMGIARNVLYFPSKIIQYFNFKRFVKARLKLTPTIYSCEEDFIRNPIHADVFCTGSDQVWNSGWNGGVIPAYFLDFVEKKEGVKKISFAASFGSSKLNQEDKSIIEPLLRDYNYITVREKNSVEMLSSEFGIESKEILDPTLQMDGEFWKSLCKKERYCREKYVLLIQLNRNHEFDNLAVKFAEQNKLELVRLCLRIDQILLPGKHIVIPEVEDYVRLVRDAEFVLTDSFHAVSFCLNLNKQFFVYYPEKYSERLRSILEILQLKNRELKSLDYEKVRDIDFQRINVLLNKQREFAKNLMNNCLKNQ